MKARAVQRNNPRPKSARDRAEASCGSKAPARTGPHPLREIIRATVSASGPLPFREFMRLALYHPRYGYYRSGRAAIGRDGDYFTNVSVGALFGTLLARQFAQMWTHLGRPADFTIVEQGAHSAELASDVLAAMRRLLPDFDAAARYIIIEPSPRLRALQRKRLAACSTRVTWRRSLKELASFCGVHFSNELVDAFPVDAIVWDGNAWQERRVGFESNGFVFVEVPLMNPELRQRLDDYPTPPGIRYMLEINTAADEWMAAIAQRLSRGYLLTIDYGAPRRDLLFPAHTTGTLRGYSQHHRVANVLADPGTIDITAHVDFTALARCAEKITGLHLHGFADQHHFMVGLGAVHFHDSDETSDAAAREIRNFKTLMHPEMMGRSFHALCFQKGIDDDALLAGFQFAPRGRAALGLAHDD
jgi:SAM-dependent MidA family methyltransferase